MKNWWEISFYIVNSVSSLASILFRSCLFTRKCFDLSTKIKVCSLSVLKCPVWSLEGSCSEEPSIFGFLYTYRVNKPQHIKHSDLFHRDLSRLWGFLTTSSLRTTRPHLLTSYKGTRGMVLIHTSQGCGSTANAGGQLLHNGSATAPWKAVPGSLCCS